jgi:putative hemolysin
VIDLLVILVLVLVNGVFAGAEIAIVSVRTSRLIELRERGRRAARDVLALRDAPERFLATVQVGITVVSATAAAFGGEVVAGRIIWALRDVAWIGAHAEAVALAVVVSGVSFLSIVVGELVPKSLALRSAERYALLVARPLRFLAYVARPLVWLLSSSANLLLKPFGDQTTFTEARHSADEIQQLVEEGTKAGTIHPEAGEIASRALHMPLLTVADVMVPRQDVVTIPRHAGAEELRRILLEHTHGRMPVYEGRQDNVVGYISTKELLAVAWEEHLIVLEDVIRPPYFVPKTKPVVELLQEMRRRHQPFAIAVDEQGGMCGIVTMEDVLEELVGEIFSEHAVSTPELFTRSSDGTLLIVGSAPIRHLNRELGLALPEDSGCSTVAGLCLVVSGRIPSPGERLELADGVTIEVVEASPRRVRSVRLLSPFR